MCFIIKRPQKALLIQKGLRDGEVIQVKLNCQTSALLSSTSGDPLYDNFKKIPRFQC